jgi:peptide/nickel transport system substrate-binding protein
VVVIAAAMAMLGIVTGTSAGAVPSATKPVHGGTLTVINGSDHSTGWDPIRLQGIPRLDETPMAPAIYDTLFYEDAKTHEIKGRLATSIDPSDGFRVWTMKLQPNVMFSDKTPFNAEAVQYNWQRIMDPANRALAATAAAGIQTLDVVDPLTLRITLKQPDANFNRRVTYSLGSIASPTALKSEGANFGSNPVGAGPFVLKEWIRDSQYTFERNPSYWRSGRPYLDRLVVKVIVDDPARFNTMDAGGANIYQTGDPPHARLGQQAGYKLVTIPSNGGGEVVLMNNSRPPFNDVRVRQAVQLAIDRVQYNKAARGGFPDLVMNTLDEPSSPYYDANLKVPDTNLKKAQQLIDQVVAETGKPIEFTYSVYAIGLYTTAAEQIQAQLARLKNITMKVDAANPIEVVRRQTTGEYEAASSSIRWQDPAIDLPTQFMSTSTLNFLRYNNPEVDAALNQLTSATDAKAKKAAHVAVLEHVVKDSPMAWLGRFRIWYVMDRTVQGWNGYYDNRVNLDDVWLANTSRK